MRTASMENLDHAEPPLWSMALIVLFVFVTPLVLYSLAPSGPLRGGDTVFPEGQQQAPILRSAAAGSGPKQDTCLLDAENPLIVIQTPAERADGKILAQVQGNPTTDWPFCQALTDILLMPNQIVQKPDMLKAVKNTAASILRP